MNALEIFKYLPGGNKGNNANCKKCGCPTCMAFALKLSKSQIDVNLCEFVSENLKEKINFLSKKQQNEIILSNNVKTGGETVIYRHDKTFVNGTVLGIALKTSDINFKCKLNEISNFNIVRVGDVLKIDAIYLINDAKINDLSFFINEINNVGLAIILVDITNSIINYNLNNVVYFENYINNLINKNENILITFDNVSQLEEKTTFAINKGFENLILQYNIENKKINDIIRDLTNIRTKAIIDRNNLYTHPILTYIKGNNDIIEDSFLAGLLLCKYSNIIIFDQFNKEVLTSILTLKQNIYTNPQKPLQVEYGVYKINEPNNDIKNALVIITTNFALTYYAVANELENINKPIFLLITPSDGLSVLTAYSADKFNSNIVKQMLDSPDLKQIEKKQVILPGLLSNVIEELKEEIKDWEFIPGPIDAAGLPDFIKNLN